MVCCDACNRWIHLSCAGLEGRRADSIERLLSWHCVACLQESSAECDACKYGAHKAHTCLRAKAQTKANQQEKDRKEAKAQAKAQTKAQTEANQQAQRDNRKEARKAGRQEFVHFTAGVDPRLPVISLLPAMKVKNCRSHVGRKAAEPAAEVTAEEIETLRAEVQVVHDKGVRALRLLPAGVLCLPPILQQRVDPNGSCDVSTHV
jgi:pyruvate/2-oxoglutarate dehydrogenase complex dihydrolipoamide acyltransferase (E2) component